jgi:hypothetical protein
MWSNLIGYLTSGPSCFHNGEWGEIWFSQVKICSMTVWERKIIRKIFFFLRRRIFISPSQILFRFWIHQSILDYDVLIILKKRRGSDSPTLWHRMSFLNKYFTEVNLIGKEGRQTVADVSQRRLRRNMFSQRRLRRNLIQDTGRIQTWYRNHKSKVQHEWAWREGRNDFSHGEILLVASDDDILVCKVWHTEYVAEM